MNHKTTFTGAALVALVAVFALWAPGAAADRYTCKIQAGPGICDEGPPYFMSQEPCEQCDVDFCQAAHIFDEWYDIQYEQCYNNYDTCVQQCCAGPGGPCYTYPSCQCAAILDSCVDDVAEDHKSDCQGSISMRNICKSNNNCSN